MAGTTCNCGHEMFDGRGCCPACYDHQQKSAVRRSEATSQTSTPPPSRMTSPRQSADRGRGQAQRDFLALRTSSPAVASLNRAFATTRADDEMDRDLFSPHLYRTPTKSPAPMSASPRSSVSLDLPDRTRSRTIRHSHDNTGPVVDSLRQSVSPEASRQGSLDRGYSPMAAGFARIRSRETREQQMLDERRISQRESADLAARLFDGPA